VKAHDKSHTSTTKNIAIMKAEKRLREYQPPCTKALSIVSEAGFATSSPLQYEKTPSMDYGDNGEQWF
jgi:hypothetical protein